MEPARSITETFSSLNNSQKELEVAPKIVAVALAWKKQLGVVGLARERFNREPKGTSREDYLYQNLKTAEAECGRFLNDLFELGEEWERFQAEGEGRAL